MAVREMMSHGAIVCRPVALAMLVLWIVLTWMWFTVPFSMFGWIGLNGYQELTRGSLTLCKNEAAVIVSSWCKEPGSIANTAIFPPATALYSPDLCIAQHKDDGKVSYASETWFDLLLGTVKGALSVFLCLSWFLSGKVLVCGLFRNVWPFFAVFVTLALYNIYDALYVGIQADHATSSFMLQCMEAAQYVYNNSCIVPETSVTSPVTIPWYLIENGLAIWNNAPTQCFWLNADPTLLPENAGSSVASFQLFAYLAAILVLCDWSPVLKVVSENEDAYKPVSNDAQPESEEEEEEKKYEV